MADLSRRQFLAALATSTALPALPAFAQPQPQANGGQPAPKFSFEEVVKRARDLAAMPYEASAPLPEAVQKLDFEAWRDIRFKSERALFANSGGPFRLQTFHLGHLYKQPVVVNTIRDGIATPIPYSAQSFDYGRSKFERPLPVNLGFAGFRLHYPLNDPRTFDEAISFLGASYFRFLGRNQRYGLSARGLAVNAGTQMEQFPAFREFWIEMPEAGSDRATIFALLDGEAVTGAFRFTLWPNTDAVLDVSATIFPRKAGLKFGLAPLTSMFFVGENDRRAGGDYRPELHDSDGLLVQTGTGEWIWRPLRNPASMEVSAFLDRDIRGFGLVQRDRTFEHYQDLDLNYEMRPTYWIEPKEGWGEGRVELVELATTDETNDNIVASWTPREPLEVGKPFAFGYRITSSLRAPQLSPNGRAINTYQTHARALGSAEPATAGRKRFIVDFAGGDLGFFKNDPAMLEVVSSASNGKIVRSFLMPNPNIQGFRAVIDVQLDPGQSTDLRAFLRAGSRTLTETWTYPWKAE